MPRAGAPSNSQKPPGRGVASARTSSAEVRTRLRVAGATKELMAQQDDHLTHRRNPPKVRCVGTVSCRLYSAWGGTGKAQQKAVRARRIKAERKTIRWHGLNDRTRNQALVISWAPNSSCPVPAGRGC
jgi:hypothetical protein